MFQSTNLRTFFSRFPRRYIIGVIALIILGVVGTHWFLKPASPTNTSLDSGISHINVASVSALSSATSSLPVIGTVTSLNQATVLSQTSGEIVALPSTLGDSVSAGEVIAEFANSSQRAAVLQANGAYEAAQAGLANVQETSVKGSTISVGQASQGIQNAQNALQNALQNMYAVQDDAVHTKADQLFLNPRTPTVQIILTVPDYQLVLLIRQERLTLQRTFQNILSYTKDTPGSTFDARSASMITAAHSVIQFLNHLTTAVSETPPSTKAPSPVLVGYASSLSGARSEVIAGLSGLIAAKSAYDNARTGVQAATNSAGSGITNNIALAQARVKQARGFYNAAQANLNKTIIRSPINGTIVSLPITRGDYVPMFSPVVIVSNPHALYIKTSVTSANAQTLEIGDRTLINNSLQGVVTFIAPALDPLTHKIEVKIGIAGAAPMLTDGETVTVLIIRGISHSARVNASDPNISLPIKAIKMTPDGAAVFSVNASSTIVTHTVKLGNIIGGTVIILSGVTPNMRIVTDARGLSNGQAVIVDTN